MIFSGTFYINIQVQTSRSLYDSGRPHLPELIVPSVVVVLEDYRLFLHDALLYIHYLAAESVYYIEIGSWGFLLDSEFLMGFV